MLKWGAASGVIHTNYFRLLKPLSWLSDYSPCTPLKSKKKKPSQNTPKKTGNNLNVLMWQMPDSKTRKCAQTMHLKLSSQYLTSSNKPPELIQNASTLNIGTRKEPSSSHKKIMNHKVNFLLSRWLWIVASMILLSASPCPDPVLLQNTHRDQKGFA